MQLNTNRIFNDRLIFDHSIPCKLRVANSFWDWIQRIISWIYSPSAYSEENRRTVSCFKKYLTDVLGESRLQRICSRYSVKLEENGSPLLSRDVAKIVIGAQCVSVADIDDLPSYSSVQLAKKVEELRDPFLGQLQVKEIIKPISGRPTDWLSCYFYDPFLADRERLQICKENPRDNQETFVHNLSARVIKREMDVGTLIPAPNHPSGKPQFYYVSAKLVTGEGMVSYILHPATSDTNLEPLRLFRGTSARSGEIDAISTVITDFERHLGKEAFESGEQYEAILQEKGMQPAVEIGHSLGSTIVQYRLAHKDHIQKAYLFCGPGLPMREVRKFNEKNLPIQLFIRHSHRDILSNLGDAHLGFRASPNTHVEFWKYHPPRKKMHQSPHVAVWGREKIPFGIEGGLSGEHRDAALYYEKFKRERLRTVLGPIIAAALRGIRTVVRTCFNTRTNTEMGLKTGQFKNGLWQVEHFRPM